MANKNEEAKAVKDSASVKDEAKTDAAVVETATPPEEAGEQLNAAKVEKKYKLTINSETGPGGSDAVFVGVNGKQSLVPRDKECVVSEGVINVLNDAVMKLPIMDDEGKIIGWRQAKAHSFVAVPIDEGAA
ncbi:hypothetical protein [Oceanidesulfovibrio marinus]|uniref:Uncharacterized protein n=1 Tax=Oceanidesulfovibrio marinus TaxID=370038 RepID=A0A6P1ZMY3_9BACT|nr:hypothetical protein [Oceanidesulfovibrio marinus]TVM35608.1 hypothetical protein DQK91_02790 [Oceanidesulfovibrio marinus]